MMSAQATSSVAPSPVGQQSPWHSPVPYLFGGLAAMLGLIAFALLILACSYWRLSGNFENSSEADRDIEAAMEGGSKPDTDKNKAPAVFEEKYLVIMAGHTKPTCLATPISSRASSFGSSSCRSNLTATTSSSEVEMTEEKEKQGSGDNQARVSNMENP